MNKDDEKVFVEAFNYAFKKNYAAIEMCLNVIRVLHLWDDLIDQDREITKDDINKAFISLFFDIPMNPFYQVHQATLTPVLMNLIIKWQDANALEGPETAVEDKHKAYMLRAGMYDLFCMVAYLIGGYEWSRTVSPGLRRLYGENLHEYLEEMKNA